MTATRGATSGASMTAWLCNTRRQAEVEVTGCKSGNRRGLLRGRG